MSYSGSTPASGYPLPLLGPDLSLSLGLRASCAVSGLVTLREPSPSSCLASCLPACPATNLSLSPDGAQDTSRACLVLVRWSLVMCVHALPSPSTQALTQPASRAPLPPPSPIPSFQPPGSLLPFLRCLSACPLAQALLQPDSAPCPPVRTPPASPRPSAPAGEAA